MPTTIAPVPVSSHKLSPPKPPRRGSAIRAIGRELLRHPMGMTEYQLIKETRLNGGTVHNALKRIDRCGCSLVTVHQEVTEHNKMAFRYQLTDRGIKYAKGKKF